MGGRDDRLGFRLVVALLWRCIGLLRPVRWHVALLAIAYSLIEILHRKECAAATDPEKFKELEDRYAIDRRRVESSLETAIARVRRGQRAGSIG